MLALKHTTRNSRRGPPENRRRLDITTGADGSFLAQGIELARYVAWAEHEFPLSSTRPSDFGIDGPLGFGMEHANRRYEELEIMLLYGHVDRTNCEVPDERTIRKIRALTDMAAAQTTPLPTERETFCRYVVGVHFGIGKDNATTARFLNSGTSAWDLSSCIGSWHVRNALITQAKPWTRLLGRAWPKFGTHAVRMVELDALAAQHEATAIETVLRGLTGQNALAAIIASGEALKLYREALYVAPTQGSTGSGVIRALLEHVALLRSLLPKDPL